VLEANRACEIVGIYRASPPALCQIQMSILYKSYITGYIGQSVIKNIYIVRSFIFRYVSTYMLKPSKKDSQ